MKLIVSALLLIGISSTLAYMIATNKPEQTNIETASKDTLTCARLSEEKPPMVWLEGGSFSMGSSDFYPEEGPIKNIQLDGFWIDRYEVTNAQFAKFVDETAYQTVSERQLDPDDFPGIPADQLKPGSVVFIMPTKLGQGGSLTDWWQFVPGAYWREPHGPGSNITGKENHPVVHIAHEDALAYATWAGRELPTEAQWEFAARGGLQGQPYAWGKEFRPDDTWRANTWQGMFPLNNEEEDGYLATAPAGCYPANSYGIHDMIGNVWEWVDDWYYPGHQDTGTEAFPRGYDPRQPDMPVKVIKGGSYLCAKNYCMRYRPSARHAQETTLSAAHIGFRTVLNNKKG